MFGDFFRGKNVLITGHTGFKGSWLSIWLNELGANVTGYALAPRTERDNFVVTGLSKKVTDIRSDIRGYERLKKTFKECRPDIVFHLAAQSLVKDSYKYPRETYEINVLGTVNVLEISRQTDSVKVIINVTSDKCYDNKEWIWGYREDEPMGGYDPYSSSKGCSELVTSAYRRSFFEKLGKSLSSVRAGNAIGGGDWAENRLVPDCIRALERERPLEVRNPEAIRPWQHVLEPLSGYLLLASKMYEGNAEYCGAFNFGPDDDSVIEVRELVELVIERYGKGEWKDVSSPHEPHEAKLLKLDTTKSKLYLNWKPRWDIKKSVEKTVDWYKNIGKKDLYQFCVQQINEYIKG